MVIEVFSKSRQVVFQNEDAKEFRVSQLHRHVPRKRRQTKSAMPGIQQVSHHETVVAFGSRENHYDHRRQKWRNRSLGQHCQSQKDVEQGQVTLAGAFVPRIPGQHGDA